ncbi:MAG TPA: SH3 domain-containing protein [Acidobacteriaceae bacterium]
MLLGILLLQGCARLTPHASHEYVYVWARGTFLRDRVAAVSNRVAEVTNGQRLQVLEHARRFLRVKTDKGEIGWIEDHAVIDQNVYDRFGQMEKDNASDPVVATAILREDYWLRDAPGRTSNRFYLLPENAKLQLLMRASVPRPEAPQAVPLPTKKTVKAGKAEQKKNVDDLANPALEDYWLVRASSGRVGWIRGRTLDEDVPDAIAGLAEGQKVVGAYVLRTVEDPGANVPGNQVPEYVTVMAPWRDGLPFDFDQLRVFTWNVKKHRYETAYRERNIAGYLPVTVTRQTFGNQTEPVFSFRAATDPFSASLDPQTGVVRPDTTTIQAYHMEGVLVRRVGAPAPVVSSAARSIHERRHRRHRR